MLKKLNANNKKKRSFIERAASVHPCDMTCMVECITLEVPKLNLMYKVDLH